MKEGAKRSSKQDCLQLYYNRWASVGRTDTDHPCESLDGTSTWEWNVGTCIKNFIYIRCSSKVDEGGCGASGICSWSESATQYWMTHQHLQTLTCDWDVGPGGNELGYLCPGSVIPSVRCSESCWYVAVTVSRPGTRFGCHKENMLGAILLFPDATANASKMSTFSTCVYLGMVNVWLHPNRWWPIWFCIANLVRIFFFSKNEIK